MRRSLGAKFETTMNRRAFFASLTAAFALDPERVLWTPGKKLISIPKPRRRYRLAFDPYLTEDIEPVLLLTQAAVDRANAERGRIAWEYRRGDTLLLRAEYSIGDTLLIRRVLPFQPHRIYSL